MKPSPLPPRRAVRVCVPTRVRASSSTSLSPPHRNTHARASLDGVVVVLTHSTPLSGKWGKNILLVRPLSKIQCIDLVQLDWSIVVGIVKKCADRWDGRRRRRPRGRAVQ